MNDANFNSQNVAINDNNFKAPKHNMGDNNSIENADDKNIDDRIYDNNMFENTARIEGLEENTNYTVIAQSCIIHNKVIEETTNYTVIAQRYT